jgi:hypothetical protein
MQVTEEIVAPIGPDVERTPRPPHAEYNEYLATSLAEWYRARAKIQKSKKKK